MDSKLQIISGELHARTLRVPHSARPTQNMARAAVFNMLGEILLEPYQKLAVWDAFAGSGALGIEVLSRYNDSTAIFTDVSDDSLNAVRQNVRDIDWARVKIDASDAASRIWKYAPRVNLVFVDPPYEDARVGIDFVAGLADYVAHNTIVVQEIEKVVPYSPDETKWEILRDKTYGRARFLILRRRGNK